MKPWRGGALAALAGLAAAALVQARTRRAERDFPPQGRFITAGGVRLHYLDQGAGEPAIVFLHGNGAMAQDLAASGVAGRLTGRHRLLCFDRPGFGYSARPRDRFWTARAQAAVLAEALAALGIEAPILVGHSWGTLVALALALEHPGAAGGLVLLSGYYLPERRAEVASVMPLAVPLLGDILRHTLAPLLVRPFAGRALGKVFAPAPVPPRFLRGEPVAMTLRPSQIRAAAEDSVLMNASAAWMLPRLGRLAGLPVCILTGGADRIVAPERHSRRLHALLPGSRFRLLPGVGHMIHYAAPDLVAAAIGDMAAERHRTPLPAPPAR